MNKIHLHKKKRISSKLGKNYPSLIMYITENHQTFPD